MLSRLDNIAANVGATHASPLHRARPRACHVGAAFVAAHGGRGIPRPYTPTAVTQAGFDRFGRIIDQKWANTTGTVKDEFLYGYDRAGNRTYRDIPSSLYAGNDKDQAFAYDNLHRLVSYNRGTLSSGTITDGAANFNQQWPRLETLGNWRTFRWDADGGADTWTTQSRSHNKVNEIDTDDDHANTPGNSISGTGADWFIPKYDAAGNMIQMPMAMTDYENSGMHVAYDAWNRMVEAKTDAHGSPGTTIATYRYDGNGRRIQKTVGDDTFDYYYNEGYQLLEVRKNGDGDPLEQYAWDITYIDAPLVRWHDSNTDGTVDDTFYPTHDANFNVTALIDASGTVQERYLYDPYGKRTILDSSWGARGSSSYDWSLGHQGLMHDGETGLIYNRARMLHSTLGLFIQRDPLVYIDGMSLYQLESDSPINALDPTGHAGWFNCCKAIAELVAATVKLQMRLLEAINPDPGHIRAIENALTRVENASVKVIRHCGGEAANVAIAAAQVQIAAAMAFLRGCKRANDYAFDTVDDALQWIKDHPTEAIVGTVIIVGTVTFIVATDGAGAVILVPAI